MALSAMVLLSRGPADRADKELLYEDPSISDSLQIGQNVTNRGTPMLAVSDETGTPRRAEK